MDDLTPHEIESRKRAAKVRKLHKQLDKLWEELLEKDQTAQGRSARSNIGKAMDSLLIAVHFLEEA